MNENVGLRPKPEEEELNFKRRELEGAETQLVERELYLASFKREVNAFERRYLETVGVRYAELDEIEARIAEFLARREAGNLEAQTASREARTRAEKSRSSATILDSFLDSTFPPSPSLKNLYREVARRIHPDLAGNDADRAKRQQHMADANRAYQDGDEARLRAILDEYENSPESVQGDGTAAELVRAIRKISRVKRRLSEIAEELRELMGSELYELKRKVDDGKTQGRDLLKEMAQAVGLRIREAQAKWKALSEGHGK